MRILPLAAAVAAVLVPAAPAFAGDPIMPLSQVHAGMRCTGYSVIQGTDISSFDVDILDVADGDAVAVPPRILVQVSGPAVDATGVGPGFSGSPIYCTDGAGVARNVGAISESLGEYGNKTALATPIESILATPVDPPGRPAAARGKSASARGRAARAERAKWSRLLKQARPLTAPLTVTGLSRPVASALTAAGARRGMTVLAAPAGPLGSFPVQTLRPGSAVGVGYSSGDISFGSIGTVSYVDGDKVWAFGHPLEGVGGRALLLQDAYVYRVVNNPLGIGNAQTYKLAAQGHDLGTLGDDGTNAVAGRVGALPHTVAVHVLARDVDAGQSATVDVKVADEAAVDLPSGGSWTSSVAPLAILQAASDVLGSSPSRLTGDMCARIEIGELKRPMRFCNRYVSTASQPADDGSAINAVVSGAASDLANALGDIDAYTGRPPHVNRVSVLLKLRRTAEQAFMRRISAPSRVRPGQRVRVRVSLQRVRGARMTRTYAVRIPRNARPGRLRLLLVGRDADEGDIGLTTIIIGDDGATAEGGDPGPKTLQALARQVSSLGRFDGVTLHAGRASSHAFRDDGLRISGHAEVTVRVVARHARHGSRLSRG
jgi:hypothetical protein